MKVLNIIPSMAVQSGGPTQSTFLLAEMLIKRHLDIEIATVDSAEKDVISREKFIHYASVSESNYFSFMHFLKQFTPDLIHIQGLWHPLVHAGIRFAQSKNIPYLVSTRGMLYPSALQVSSLKKRFGWSLYQKQDLEKAALIHATCLQELNYNRQKGVTVPIAVIPNAISIQEPEFTPLLKEKKRIGFIGRFHPIKNIDVLLKAWSKIDTTDCELVLVGSGEVEYMEYIHKLTKNLHLENIVFAGFLQREEKQKMISTFHYQILPSQSENFGMVVPEALIQAVPVIASKGTPWEELDTHNCGWWVDNDVDTLAATLHKALLLPENECVAMGERGKRLVKEYYSVEIVAEKMKGLYEWILGIGDRPEFVYLK